jgi:hypothetical protein
MRRRRPSKYLRSNDFLLRWHDTKMRSGLVLRRQAAPRRRSPHLAAFLFSRASPACGGDCAAAVFALFVEKPQEMDGRSMARRGQYDVALAASSINAHTSFGMDASEA